MVSGGALDWEVTKTVKAYVYSIYLWRDKKHLFI